MFSCAVIGLGQIGYGFEKDPLRAKPASHIGALKLLKDKIQLISVADNDAGKCEESVSYYGPEGYNVNMFQYGEMLIDSAKDVDILVVATPPNTHYDLCERAIKKLKPKLIFCEKPLCEESFVASILNLDCRKLGVKLAVNHTRRWDPFWRHVKQLVDDRKLGELKNFVGIYSGSPLNVGVHMADLANWFNPPVRDAVNVDSDCVVFDVKLFFEKGMIDVVNNGAMMSKYVPMNSLRFTGVKEYSEDNTVWSQRPSDGETPIYSAYINILNHLEKGEPLACDGDDGLEDLRIIDSWWIG